MQTERTQTLVTHRNTWQHRMVHFTQSCWGIKANMQPCGDDFKFTFPLMITEIVPKSEADVLGLKKFDYVIAYQTDTQDFFLDVQQVSIKNCEQQFIDRKSQHAMIAGGKCILKISSRVIHEKCECCDSSLVFHDQEGCYVCHKCGVSVNTIGVSNLDMFQGSGVLQDFDLADDLKYVMKRRKIVTFSNTPTSITKSRIEIEKICSAIDICDGVAKNAFEIFKQYYSKKQIFKKKIRRVNAVVVACIMMSGNQLGHILDCEEIISHLMRENSSFVLKRQEVKRIKTEICNFLNIEPSATSVAKMCELLCTQCNLSIKNTEKAKKICKFVSDLTLCNGHVASSISAASVYVVTCLTSNDDSDFSLKKLSRISGVAELTIKKTADDCIMPFVQV